MHSASSTLTPRTGGALSGELGGEAIDGVRVRLPRFLFFLRNLSLCITFFPRGEGGVSINFMNVDGGKMEGKRNGGFFFLFSRFILFYFYSTRVNHLGDSGRRTRTLCRRKNRDTNAAEVIKAHVQHEPHPVVDGMSRELNFPPHPTPTAHLSTLLLPSPGPFFKFSRLLEILLP